MASAVDYPARIKTVVSRLTASTQKALKAQLSRIIVDLPPGAEFGIESAKKSAFSKSSDPADQVRRSSREAARLFTEMFSVLGSTTVVQFPTDSEASSARSSWGGKFKGTVLATEQQASKGYGSNALFSKRFTEEERKAALLGKDGIYVPDGTEVFIMVGARQQDLAKVLQLHRTVGLDCLVILLNAYLPSSHAEKGENRTLSVGEEIDQAFERVFHYAPPKLRPEVIGKRELLLFHEMKGPWYLAEKPTKFTPSVVEGMVDKVIQAVSGEGKDMVTLWQGPMMPSESEIVDILRSHV